VKAIVNRGELTEALDLAALVAPTRTPKPSLQAVKLECRDGRLFVSATDLEQFFSGAVAQVQVEKEGAALVAADKLRDCVRSLNDDTLSIEAGGAGPGQVEIRGNDSRFKLFVAANVKEFPPCLDGGDGDVTDVTLQAGSLRRMAALVAFAAARESTRYSFNGVYFAVNKGHFRMVATDGRRMAMVEVKDAAYADKRAAAIVPVKAVKVLDRILATVEGESQMSVRIGERRVTFKPEGGPALATNLVEGQFPPYEDVIPKGADKTFTCAREALLSAVRRAALLTTEESKGIVFAFSKGGLTLTASDPTAGEATVKLASKYDGQDMEIAFNPGYVADALKAVDAAEVSIEMTAPNRPGLLKAGNDFLYVIMPVNRQ